MVLQYLRIKNILLNLGSQRIFWHKIFISIFLKQVLCFNSIIIWTYFYLQCIDSQMTVLRYLHRKDLDMFVCATVMHGPCTGRSPAFFPLLTCVFSRNLSSGGICWLAPPPPTQACSLSLCSNMNIRLRIWISRLRNLQ
jgi:hypothetical protein